MNVPHILYNFSIQVALLVFAALAIFANAVPESALHARHAKNAGDLRNIYDIIIVGGGTAGLTIGDRLTESSKYNVLVVEYGEFVNASDQSTILDRRSTIPSKPQVELGNRVTEVNVGYCVGGSSAINGMAVLQGSKRDYDIWAELGNKGSTWNWNGLLPYFRKAIHFIPPDPTLAADYNITYDIKAAWGQYKDTRVYASYPGGLDPNIKTIYGALNSVPGLEIVRDGHAGSPGVFYYPVSVDPATHRRSYSRTGHWDNLKRQNYDIITGSRVNKILFDRKNEATGVQFVPSKGESRVLSTVKARKEVILSAGAVHTPQILQLSGIGPASLLKKAKIPVRVDLPGTGSNFQDHPIGPHVSFSYGVQPPSPSTNSTNLPPSEGQGQGLVALLSLPAIAPDTYRNISQSYASQNLAKYVSPDTTPTVLAGYKAQQAMLSKEMRGNLTFLNYIIRPTPASQPIGFHITSRGTVQIDPTSPDAPEPIIDYRALSNPTDIDLMISYIQFLRRFFLKGPLSRYNTTEVTPGANVTSYEDLARYVRDNYIPQGWHPVGTAAKMRRELGGVVDDELRVYGVKKLRVADASIMPMLIGGTTQLIAYAISEKAADLIKEGLKEHGGY